MDTLPVLFFVMAMGALIGSFFNVLIWRIPRNESIVFPGSHCPACNRSIKAYENIPVLSFLFLRGRCAGCKSAISWRYPLIELLTAGCFGTLFLVFCPHYLAEHGTHWSTIVKLFIMCYALIILIPLSVIDIDFMILPDSMTLSGIAIALLAIFLPIEGTPYLHALGAHALKAGLGILAGGGLLYAVGAIGALLLKRQEAMGGGDIKFMAFLGALFGWEFALQTIVFGSLLGTLGALILLATRKLSKDHLIPFGPYLALGAWIAALAGNWIITSYMLWLDGLMG